MYRGKCIGYMAFRQIRRLSLLLKPQYSSLLTGLLKFSFFLSFLKATPLRYKECDYYAPHNQSQTPIRDSLFWSNFLHICVGAWRHCMTDRPCTTVAMETAAPLGLLLLSMCSFINRVRGAQSVRDAKLRGQMRLDGLNTFSPKGYVWAKTKQQLFWHKTFL